MLGGRARDWPLGFSLELFVVMRMLGQRDGNAGGGDSSALVVMPPVALISVGGDANDTMPRLVAVAGRVSSSLPILRSCATPRKRGGLALVRADLAPPVDPLYLWRRASRLRTRLWNMR